MIWLIEPTSNMKMKIPGTQYYVDHELIELLSQQAMEIIEQHNSG